MTNGFIYLKGSCPVCQGARKDCRQNLTTTLYHCRDTSANPLNYVERGLDAHGFTMWADKADCEEWQDEKAQEYREQRLREQENRKRALANEQASRCAASLSPGERSVEFEKLLGQLSLSDHDRQQLHKRGLTDNQIDATGYRSLNQWQKLTSPINERLAGIKRGGYSLLNGSSGILCPIRDVDGFWVGAQIKCDDGVYKWLIGDKSLNPRPTSHLPNGELPLAIYGNVTSEGIVGLTEGTSFKPYLAHLRLNIPVLGAAGGNHASSPQTLKQSLKALNAKKIVLYPDAGSLSNKSILAAYQKTIRLLESWDYKVEIAWWYQYLKSDGDIDEISLEKVSSIKYIEANKFFEQVETFLRRKYTSDLTYNEKYLPYIDFKEGNIYGVKSGLGTGKTTILVEYLDNHFEDIAKNQTQVIFLGTRNTLLKQTIHKTNNAIDRELGKHFIHINDKDNIDIEKDRLIALCIDSLMKIDLDKVDNPVLILDEIISLWGCSYFAKTHIDSYRTEIIKKFWALVNKAKLVICLDANLTDWALEPFLELANKPVIKVDNRFKAETKHPYRFLRGTFFNETKKLSKNDKRPMIRDIIEQAKELVEINQAIKQAIKDKNFELVDLLTSMRAPLVIASDSQSFCEIIDKLLTELGLKGYRLDSKTSGLLKSQEFLENPDNWIFLNRPDFLIYSPSAESGLDISIKGYFKHRFCFFFGSPNVNLVDSVTQMIKRVRDDLSTQIWVRTVAVSLENAHNITGTLNQLQQKLDREFNLKIEVILKDEKTSNDLKIQLLGSYKQAKGYHYNFALAMRSQAQNEQLNYRDSVIDRMRELGYPVELYTEIDPYLDETKSRYKVAKDITNLEDATAIYEAPLPIFVDGKWQTELIESNEGYWAGKVKAYIYNQLPGISSAPIWGIEFINLIRKEHPYLVRQLTLETKVRNTDLNNQANSTNYKKLLKGEFKNLWNLNDDVGLIDSLRDIGLLELVDSDESFLITDELPQRIIKACRTWTHRQFLGSQGKLNDQDWLRRLLTLVGYRLESKRVRINGQRVWEYWVIRILENLPVIDALTESLLFKLSDRAKKGSELPWEINHILSSNEVLPVQKEKEEVFFNKVPETLTENELDPVHLKLNSLNGFTSEMDSLASDSVLLEKQEDVLPIEPTIKPEILAAKDALVGIDYTTKEEVRTFEYIIKDFGHDNVAAAIPLISGVDHSEHLNQRLTLQVWLRELETGIRVGSKVIFLGVEHFLTTFKGSSEVILRVIESGLEVLANIEQVQLSG